MSSDETYDLGLLEQSRAKWQRSPALRAYYASLYREMQRCAAPGPALELGSGCGLIREFIPDVVTSDLRKTRYVDCAASAYELDGATGGPWATIYLLDVFHHLREPFRFLKSAAGALQPGGRIVLLEPAATLLGRWFYRSFHHEPMAPERIVPPFVLPPDDASGSFANMAMAYALFCRDRTETDRRLREFGLRVVTLMFRDVLGYPATGGFSRPALLPAAMLRACLRAEGWLPQWILSRAGLRMVVAIQRS